MRRATVLATAMGVAVLFGLTGCSGPSPASAENTPATEGDLNAPRDGDQPATNVTTYLADGIYGSKDIRLVMFCAGEYAFAANTSNRSTQPLIRVPEADGDCPGHTET